MRWDSVFAIVPVCVSSFGMVLTIATFAIFFKNRDTPLVRASGRELSYVILSGLLVCYLNTYILLAKPGTVVCLLQRSVGRPGAFLIRIIASYVRRFFRVNQIHASSLSYGRKKTYLWRGKALQTRPCLAVSKTEKPAA